MRGEKARRVVYLARHGQYTPEDRGGGLVDGPLTALGREQAVMLGRRLSYLPISVIHHSTLQRAAETAALVGAQIRQAELRPSDLLRECIPTVPPPEALSPEQREFFARLPAAVIEEGRAATELAFDTYLGPVEAESHELVISHGNLICALVARTLRAPLDAWLSMDIHHCGMTQIVVGVGRGRLLVCHSDTGHLPANMRTYT